MSVGFGRKEPGSGFSCPSCPSPVTMVKDSRPFDGGTRRRRECPKCKTRFTTYERVETAEQKRSDEELLHHLKNMIGWGKRAVSELERGRV